MKTLKNSDHYKIFAPLDTLDIVRQGIYPAKLTDVRRFSNVFGKRIEFTFRITEGSFLDTIIKDSATDKPTSQGKLADLLQGFEVGIDKLDAEQDLIGRDCHIAVRHERNKAGMTFAAISQTYP